MNDANHRIVATRRWLEQTVLGLDLCPFARRPWQAGRVRVVAAAGSEPEEWLALVLGEARLLLEEGAAADTSLVLLPDALDFSGLLDLQAAGDALLAVLDLDGDVQLVGFHPEFCFSGSVPEDPANGVNRSPHPLLHLLQSEAVARAADSIDVPGLTARNADLLRQRAAWKEPT